MLWFKKNVKSGVTKLKEKINAGIDFANNSKLKLFGKKKKKSKFLVMN